GRGEAGVIELTQRLFERPLDGPDLGRLVENKITPSRSSCVLELRSRLTDEGLDVFTVGQDSKRSGIDDDIDGADPFGLDLIPLLEQRQNVDLFFANFVQRRDVRHEAVANR